MRTLFLSTLILVLSVFSLSAQTELLNPDSDIDDLFGSTEPVDEPASEPEAEPEAEPEVEPEPEVEEEAALVDIVRGSSVTLSGDFLFNIGYTAGYTSVPWIPGSSAGGGGGGSGSGEGFSGFTQGAVTDTKSAMSLNFRIAPIFRIFLTFKFQFPTFESEIGEFFADYSFKDVVYLRAGRQIITWGISRYHPFTNLPARLPDVFPVIAPETGDDPLHDADSYSLKLTVPVGAGGIELLGFTRNGFMADPYYPKAAEIGWGGTYNLAIPAMDLTIGSYYHQQLNWRTFLSLGTTLFDSLDTYAEAVVSYNLDYTPSIDEPNALTYGVGAGFLYGLLNQRIQISGDYYYNTETVDLTVKGHEFPLIYGHNIAGAFVFYTLERKLRVYARVNYNVNENSGIVVPGISWNALPFFTLTSAVPIVFGDPNGTYYTDNPSENQDRSASFIIAAIFRARF